MRQEWVEPRRGQECVTQMHYARKGLATERDGGRRRARESPFGDRPRRGRPRPHGDSRQHHATLDQTARADGESASPRKCKINANIGNSAVTSDAWRRSWRNSTYCRASLGADTVMDLSRPESDIDEHPRKPSLTEVARADWNRADLPDHAGGTGGRHRHRCVRSIFCDMVERQAQPGRGLHDDPLRRV